VLGGAVRQHEALRQGERLRLPGSGGALLVAGHRALHHRYQTLHRARGGQDVLDAIGSRFWGIVEELPLPST
jgi:hypothetical protein